MSDQATVSLLCIGIFCYFLFVIWIRFREGAWIAPSTVFISFMCLAVFVNPLVALLYERLNSALLLDTLGDATIFSLEAFLAFGFGYTIACWGKRRRQGQAWEPLRRLADPLAKKIIKISVVGLLALHIWLLFSGGSFVSPKGFDAYADNPERRLGTLATVIYPLLLALLISDCGRLQKEKGRYRSAVTEGTVPTFASDAKDSSKVIPSPSQSTSLSESESRSDLRYFFVLWVVVIVVSVAVFARLAAVTLLLYFVLFWHTRVGFRAKHFAWILVGILALASGTSLKGLGTGIADMRARDMSERLGETVFSPDQILPSLGMSVAGQEVFTQIIGYVPSCEPYKYGMTYLQSTAELVKPRFLFGSYDKAELTTPAYWFLNWYAPSTEGHGFDFSMIGEAYLNFGPLCWLVFLALGCFVARLSIAIRHSTSPWMVYASVIWITALSIGMRHDSNAILKGMFYNLLPMAVVQVISRLLRRTLTSRLDNGVLKS